MAKTNRHTDGHRDSKTISAQCVDSLKSYEMFYSTVATSPADRRNAKKVESWINITKLNIQKLIQLDTALKKKVLSTEGSTCRTCRNQGFYAQKGV